MAAARFVDVAVSMVVAALVAARRGRRALGNHPTGAMRILGDPRATGWVCGVVATGALCERTPAISASGFVSLRFRCSRTPRALRSGALAHCVRRRSLGLRMWPSVDSVHQAGFRPLRVARDFAANRAPWAGCQRVSGSRTTERGQFVSDRSGQPTDVWLIGHAGTSVPRRRSG